MFSPETLRMLMREALRIPPVGAQAPRPSRSFPSTSTRVARDLVPVVAAFGPAYLETVFELLATVPHEGLKKHVLRLPRAQPARAARSRWSIG